MCPGGTTPPFRGSLAVACVHTPCPSRAGMACKMLLCCSRLLHSLVLCRVVAISCGPYVQLQLAFVQLPARACLPGGICTLALCMYRGVASMLAGLGAIPCGLHLLLLFGGGVAVACVHTEGFSFPKSPAPLRPECGIYFNSNMKAVWTENSTRSGAPKSSILITLLEGKRGDGSDDGVLPPPFQCWCVAVACFTSIVSLGLSQFLAGLKGMFVSGHDQIKHFLDSCLKIGPKMRRNCAVQLPAFLVRLCDALPSCLCLKGTGMHNMFALIVVESSSSHRVLIRPPSFDDFGLTPGAYQTTLHNHINLITSEVVQCGPKCDVSIVSICCLAMLPPPADPRDTNAT